MRNPQGQRIRLERDAQRSLRRLISPNGRTIEFQYDGARIKEASDDQIRSVGYWYDSTGRFYAVTDNAQDVTRFTYEQDLMTAIQDETGRVLLRNRYEYGRVSEQMVADGSVYRYRYVVNREGDVEQTQVTTPNGAGTALTFDPGRLVSKSAIQGF